jgi:hypothetical protein
MLADAVSSLGGNRIYINAVLVSSLTVDQAAALFLHEMLHNAGLSDRAIEDALWPGVPFGPNTGVISKRLETDCVK